MAMVRAGLSRVLASWPRPGSWRRPRSQSQSRSGPWRCRRAKCGTAQARAGCPEGATGIRRPTPAPPFKRSNRIASGTIRTRAGARSRAVAKPRPAAASASVTPEAASGPKAADPPAQRWPGSDRATAGTVRHRIPSRAVPPWGRPARAKRLTPGNGLRRRIYLLSGSCLPLSIGSAP